MFRSGWRPAVLLGIVALAACGKKGPPLAPIVRVPAGVAEIAAQRVGNDVYLTLTIPSANVDGSLPVDVSRVEIYGYTGPTAPPRGRFVEAGTLVATIPVAPPPPPEAIPAAPRSPSPEKAPVGAAVGARVTVVDSLTPDEFQPGRTLTVELPRGARPLPVTAPSPAAAGPLHRYYVAVPFSSRERPGPQPTPADVTLIEPPPAPGAVALSLSEGNVLVQWDPAGGLLGFLFEHRLGDEPDPAEDVFAVPPAAVPGAAAAAAPAGPARYNVYRTIAPLPGAAPLAAPVEQPWLKSRTAPLNPLPLTTLTFADPVEFGRQRCYVVRALQGAPPNVIEGPASAPACMTPVDTFPPEAPAGLVAVGAEGSISLIWEPGSDPDLAGYMVLRGRAGDATLQPLTPMPVTEARFIDTKVTPGTRYVYAVVAVDNAQPAANRSMPSARVEETAR